MKLPTLQDMLDLAGATGFDERAIEKMLRLYGILQAIERDEFLRGRLALTGGTALNAFYLELPRLSVDIDLQYIGSLDDRSAHAERDHIDDRLGMILKDQGHLFNKPKIRESGSRWDASFDSVHGKKGSLHVDLGYVSRMSLFGEIRMTSRDLCRVRATDILLLSPTDVIVGKLAALAQRNRARDIFDALSIAEAMDDLKLNMDIIRPAFIALVAASPDGWRDRRFGDPNANPHELCQNLMICLPTDYFLNSSSRRFRNNIDATRDWYNNSIRICQESFGDMLNLTDRERLFVDGVQKQGEINADLLGAPPDLCARIAAWPKLVRKCLRVREERSKGR